MVAFDKKTGKEVWRTPRKVDITGARRYWCVPPKVSNWFAAAAEAIIAYDPLSGKELWRHKGLESNAVPNAGCFKRSVVLTSGSPNKIALAIKAGGRGT